MARTIWMAQTHPRPIPSSAQDSRSSAPGFLVKSSRNLGQVFQESWPSVPGILAKCSRNLGQVFQESWSSPPGFCNHLPELPLLRQTGREGTGHQCQRKPAAVDRSPLAGIVGSLQHALSSTLYKKRSCSGPKNSNCGDLHQSLLNGQNVPSEVPNILSSLSVELQPYPNFVI